MRRTGWYAAMAVVYSVAVVVVLGAVLRHGAATYEAAFCDGDDRLSSVDGELPPGEVRSPDGRWSARADEDTVVLSERTGARPPRTFTNGRSNPCKGLLLGDKQLVMLWHRDSATAALNLVQVAELDTGDRAGKLFTIRSDRSYHELTALAGGKLVGLLDRAAGRGAVVDLASGSTRQGRTSLLFAPWSRLR